MTGDWPELADEELTALRDELIAALAGLPRAEWDGTREAARLRISHGDAADRLLPVVRRYGDQRAADELEVAADWMQWLATIRGIDIRTDVLRDRAAALRGEVDHDD
jgi:hypothetical protein